MMRLVRTAYAHMLVAMLNHVYVHTYITQLRYKATFTQMTTREEEIYKDMLSSLSEVGYEYVTCDA